MNKIDFRRGNVILVRFPYITDPSKFKDRPAIIIQNDIGNRFGSNLIVAAISSQMPDKKYPFHFWIHANSPEAEEAGIQKDSIIHAEIIMTIPKISVIKRLGRFDDVSMNAIDECIKISLALT